MHRRAATTLMLLATAFVPVQVFGQGAPTLELSNFSGVWQETIHEDSYERSGGPPLGDYQGIPLNAAGRMKADSHDHSDWSIPEFQCRPHSAPYQWRALGSVRFWDEIDPIGRDLTAIHVEYLRSADRVIGPVALGAFALTTSLGLTSCFGLGSTSTANRSGVCANAAAARAPSRNARTKSCHWCSCSGTVLG